MTGVVLRMTRKRLSIKGKGLAMTKGRENKR